jgi:hypothetical protein
MRIENNGGIETTGATMAINEMLVNSASYAVELFASWQAGHRASFSGIRLKGAFLTSATYDGTVVTNVNVFSEKGGVFSIFHPWAQTQTAKELDAYARAGLQAPGSVTNYVETVPHNASYNVIVQATDALTGAVTVVSSVSVSWFSAPPAVTNNTGSAIDFQHIIGGWAPNLAQPVWLSFQTQPNTTYTLIVDTTTANPLFQAPAPAVSSSSSTAAPVVSSSAFSSSAVSSSAFSSSAVSSSASSSDSSSSVSSSVSSSPSFSSDVSSSVCSSATSSPATDSTSSTGATPVSSSGSRSTGNPAASSTGASSSGSEAVSSTATSTGKRAPSSSSTGAVVPLPPLIQFFLSLLDALHIIPSEIISQLEADIAENLARLLGLTQAQILPYITIVSVNGTAPSSRRLLSADGTTFVLVSFVIDSAVSDVHSSVSVDLAVSKFTSAAQTG